MHGKFDLHHRASIEQGEKKNIKSWEEDTISLSGPDSLCACSSLLYLSSGHWCFFVLVSINGNAQHCCSDMHTPLITVRRRVSCPKKATKRGSPSSASSSRA